MNTRDEDYNIDFKDFNKPFLLEEKINKALKKNQSEEQGNMKNRRIRVNTHKSVR